MKIKKLCIIWKWVDLKNSKLFYQNIQVEDCNHLIFQIHENKLDSVEEWINGFCTNVLNPGKDELMILCHDLVSDKKSKIEFMVKKCEERCSTLFFNFGGGNDFIYYNPKKETGLLSQSGDFQDNYVLGKEGIISVFNNEKILFDSFDKVWDYYSANKFKSTIFIYLYENLLLEMSLSEFKGTIRSWLTNIPTGNQEVIDGFLKGDHPLFQENNSAFNNYQELFEARNHLVQILDVKSPNPAEVRRITGAILNNLPGQIF